MQFHTKDELEEAVTLCTSNWGRKDLNLDQNSYWQPLNNRKTVNTPHATCMVLKQYVHVEVDTYG